MRSEVRVVSSTCLNASMRHRIATAAQFGLLSHSHPRTPLALPPGIPTVTTSKPCKTSDPCAASGVSNTLLLFVLHPDGYLDHAPADGRLYSNAAASTESEGNIRHSREGGGQSRHVDQPCPWERGLFWGTSGCDDHDLGASCFGKLLAHTRAIASGRRVTITSARWWPTGYNAAKLQSWTTSLPA